MTEANLRQRTRLLKLLMKTDLHTLLGVSVCLGDLERLGLVDLIDLHRAALASAEHRDLGKRLFSGAPAKTEKPRGDVITLSADELDAVATHFGAYVQGYLGGDSRSDTDLMEMGWASFVEEVGQEKALQVFWHWNNNLPADERSDCDPDGN